MVFIQNLREDRTMSYVIFDAEKECVAEVGGRQALVVPMKPGVLHLLRRGLQLPPPRSRPRGRAQLLRSPIFN